MPERSISFTFNSQSVEDTRRLGRHLGTLLQAGDIICLSGDLGAGKTALTQGIAAGWGALEPVTSPTFTLIHEHRRAQDSTMLYHIDSYRLESTEDAWSLGLEDLWHEGGCAVIEWPENIFALLPADHLWIALDILGPNRRALSLRGNGERYVALVESLEHCLGNLERTGPALNEE